MALNTCFSSILTTYKNKYDDVLMVNRKPRVKKDKEIFIACLYAYIMRDLNLSKQQYDICLLKEDRGTDIYIREIDFEKKIFHHHPIQICEMPEKFLNSHEYSENPSERIFQFIKQKKLGHYPKNNDALLVWLEFKDSSHIEFPQIRKLMDAETEIPFTQIVLLGKASKPLCFVVATIYSRNLKHSFSKVYNCQTRRSDDNIDG